MSNSFTYITASPKSYISSDPFGLSVSGICAVRCVVVAVIGDSSALISD